MTADSTQSSNAVTLDIDGLIATLTINRPEARNAMSIEILDGMHTAVDQVAKSDASVLVITGAGRAFSAGMDLKAVLIELEQSCDTGHFDRAAVLRAVAAQRLGPAPLVTALEALGFEAAIKRAIRSSTQPDRRRHAAHWWFDAFRSMKFIHHLRDNGIASVDVQTALRDGQFLLEQSAHCVQDDITVIRTETTSQLMPPSI